MTQKTALFSLLGVGAVGGGATGIYLLSQEKTIKDRLTNRGVSLIDSKDEYEVAFLERKDKESFLTEIGSKLKTATTFADGGKELNTWCETNLEIKLTEQGIEDKLTKVEEYCSKPSVDIESRYTKLGKSLVASDKWKDKYKILSEKQPQDDSSLKKDLGIEAIKQKNDHTEAGEALKKWCDLKIKTKLVNDKKEETWKKVEKRCLSEVGNDS